MTKFNLLVFIQLLFFSCFSQASLISFGEFSNSLGDWHDASANGSVFAEDGVAKLASGSGNSPYSSVLVLGDDGNFAFNDALLIDSVNTLLHFDLWFFESEKDNSESGSSSFTDNISLAVYDAVDSSFDILMQNINVSALQTTFTLDLSALAGRYVAFSFELADENDGYNAVFALDNVFLSSATSVPEPSSLLLFFALLIPVFGRKHLI
ncbi:PEP-CTERM sorting domain-containing protein [Thalassomonas haliotis]|uniref:PEP-CTERM sorting domain-containing protein n=1 Tax=Thalassomonas haliotis TaxID=485448 RepID=A0ABY7VJF8_9GAMM|nr:PEP-CTERM sorting domain-containing protein [Thalassomonas haliotis]WDE13105.1 PEP-CTERM sorting domain-containing protein [Thalassomonas haliotis]